MLSLAMLYVNKMRAMWLASSMRFYMAPCEMSIRIVLTFGNLLSTSLKKVVSTALIPVWAKKGIFAPSAKRQK